MPDSSMLAAMARDAQGIPQDIGGAGAQPALALPDILAALKSGQISREALLQLITMLASSGQLPQGQAPSSPVEAAMLGGQQ